MALTDSPLTAFGLNADQLADAVGQAFKREFANEMLMWRLERGLTQEKASVYLHTLPYNIDRIERGTIAIRRAICLHERFVHQRNNIELRHCVVGHARINPPKH